MKRKLLTIFALFVLLLPISACGEDEEQTPSAQNVVVNTSLGYGSIAEDDKIYRISDCAKISGGGTFVEGLNKNKIVSRGIVKDSYYNIGTETVEVKGNAGYSYKVNGIHLDVSRNGTRENHFEIPTFEKVEYRLNPPTLILNYLCNDGRVRSKTYTDLSKENLEKLIKAMEKSLKEFNKDQWHDFIMSGKKETQIVELKSNQNTYKQEQNNKNLIYAALLSLFVGLFANGGSATLFLIVTIISFISLT